MRKEGKRLTVLMLLLGMTVTIGSLAAGDPLFAAGSKSADQDKISTESAPAEEGIDAEADAAPAEEEIDAKADAAPAEEEIDAKADAAPAEEAAAGDAAAPKIEGLTYQYAMAKEAATGFDVFYYSDGYKLIDIPLSGQYLIIPEGGEEPAALPEDMKIIRQPLSRVYLAASSVMSFFDQLGSLDAITMTGTDSSGWYLQAPKDAIAAGKMTYAGKYSEPDYEMLVSQDCDLAIESTMILHSPEVQEMIEGLDIPVLMDRSSYETEVLGRVEWIKLYGALTNKEDAADQVFAGQKEAIDSLKGLENTEKTIAFFSVNSTRNVLVRKTADIIPTMIELAGGKYIFPDLTNPGSNSASVKMSMEEFYSKAVNADYIIYNATIEGALSSIDDLLAKDALFGEFKAVKEGNVYQVDGSWYQSAATVAYLVTDLNTMLTGGDLASCQFLTKVG